MHSARFASWSATDFPVGCKWIVCTTPRDVLKAEHLEASGLRRAAHGRPSSTVGRGGATRRSTSGGPAMRARTEPTARKGPKGMAVRRPARPNAMSARPVMALSTKARKRPTGTYRSPCQARYQPSMAPRRTSPKPNPPRATTWSTVRATKAPSAPTVAHTSRCGSPVKAPIGARSSDAAGERDVDEPAGQGLRREVDERQHDEQGDEEEVGEELGAGAEVERRRGEADDGRQRRPMTCDRSRSDVRRRALRDGSVDQPRQPRSHEHGGGGARERQQGAIDAHCSIDPSVQSRSATQRPRGWKR